MIANESIKVYKIVSPRLGFGFHVKPDAVIVKNRLLQSHGYWDMYRKDKRSC